MFVACVSLFLALWHEEARDYSSEQTFCVSPSPKSKEIFKKLSLKWNTKIYFFLLIIVTYLQSKARSLCSLSSTPSTTLLCNSLSGLIVGTWPENEWTSRRISETVRDENAAAFKKSRNCVIGAWSFLTRTWTWLILWRHGPKKVLLHEYFHVSFNSRAMFMINSNFTVRF